VVRLGRPTARATSVHLDTVDLSAQAGADYTGRHVVLR
jgi:hypothetical protein